MSRDYHKDDKNKHKFGMLSRPLILIRYTPSRNNLLGTRHGGLVQMIEPDFQLPVSLSSGESNCNTVDCSEIPRPTTWDVLFESLANNRISTTFSSTGVFAGFLNHQQAVNK